MICICYQSQLALLACFQGLPSNVGTGLVVPEGLMPAIGSLNNALTNAAAAIAAVPAGGSAASAAPGAAAAAALSSNPQLQAAAQLSALAAATSAMNSGLGVNMTSPSAGSSCASLMSMLPELLKTLAQLPLFLLPKVQELAKVGELVEKMKDQLGVDLESPQWSNDVGDAVGGKLAEATKQAEDALKNALAGSDDAANAAAKAAALASAQAAALASAMSQSVDDATEGMLASTTGTVQSGFGIDLAAPGAMEALGAKLSSMKGGMAGTPAAIDPLEMALILSTMQMLSAIDLLRKTLGIDVLGSGAGSSLQSLLNSLGSNLASSGAASSALNSAASSAGALGASAGGGPGSADGSAGTSGGAALDSSVDGSAGMSMSNSASALANSPLANPALAQMMAGMPAMPMPLMLLTALSAQVKSTLGIQLIAHGPCG